jgi:hypothetical protein
MRASLEQYLTRNGILNQLAAPQTLPTRSREPRPRVAQTIPAFPTVDDLLLEALGPRPCTTTAFAPGESVIVGGGGFQASTSIDVALSVADIELGSTVVDASGEFVLQVQLPADLSPGSAEQVKAVGVGSNGATRTLSVAIVIGPPFTSDIDLDGTPEICDVCPGTTDPAQTDSDEDGIGDACDTCPGHAGDDADGDGLCGNVDACPFDSANDVDGDDHCANADNCPGESNASQSDADGDLVGDACDLCEGGYDALDGKLDCATDLLDVDGNLQTQALSDGLLVLRYLFGLRGPALVSGAVGPACQRCTAAEIEEYLQSILALLDIDGNGQRGALTDGLLLLRYLFGLRGIALVSGAIGPGCSSCGALEIEAYLEVI